MTNRSFTFLYPALLCGCLLASAMMLTPGNVSALEIHGQVVNATTGEPVGTVPVVIVDPRTGMVTGSELKTDSQGNFSASNLEAGIPTFVLQATYKDVMYSKMVRPEGKDRAHADIKVYETTSEWEDVHVTMPYLMMRRDHDILSVDRIFLVHNNTNPPKTITQEFRVYLPADRIEINEIFAAPLGIPIPLEYVATDTPNIYTIDYPMKPGDNRVGISLDVAYPSEKYTYTEPLQYDFDEIIAMTEDPSMKLSSETLDLGEEGEVRGFKAYVLAQMAKGTLLTLTAEGGDAHFHDDDGQQAEGQGSGLQIVTIPDPLQEKALFFMFGLAFVLVLIMATAMRAPEVDSEQIGLLTSRRNSLLNQIAKLDDLFETGTISSQLYNETRRELVDSLARTIHKIDKVQPKKAKAAPRKKGAAHAR